jgi:hypothetical protein
MKTRLLSMVAAVVVLGLTSLAQAAEKEVKLKGDLVCGSCALKEKGGCANVLVVKEGDKQTRYHLVANDVSKKYDEKTCGGDKIPVTVTGTLAEKDGKKVLTAKKIQEG